MSSRRSWRFPRSRRRFRQFFKFAVEQGYISVNPFLFRSQRADTNIERQYYISHSTAVLILQHCNDDRERLAFALGRFAGLRVPSELAGLRFCDFTGDVIRIAKDTKTGFREVPLFREVKEIFVRFSGKPDDLIFGNIKRSWQRNFLLSAIKKSGVQVWSKLWVNLRSSCITDLSKRGYDEKTLDAIFGNSAAVRRMHYIQFEKKAAYAKVLLDNEKSYVDGVNDVQSTCNQRDEIKELREDIQFLRNLLVQKILPILEREK